MGFLVVASPISFILYSVRPKYCYKYLPNSPAAANPFVFAPSTSEFIFSIWDNQVLPLDYKIFSAFPAISDSSVNLVNSSSVYKSALVFSSPLIVTFSFSKSARISSFAPSNSAYVIFLPVAF